MQFDVVSGDLIALVLMAIIGVSGLFSPEFAAQPEWDRAELIDLLKHIWIPIVVLGLGGTGGMIRVMRANLLDELRKPYVTTARTKGPRPARLVLKYPLRIAPNPFISGIGNLFPHLVSGGAIVAIVLSLPTVGPLMLTTLLSEDMYLAESLLMLLSLLGIVGTLVSDLRLLALDPRPLRRGDAMSGLSTPPPPEAAPPTTGPPPPLAPGPPEAPPAADADADAAGPSGGTSGATPGAAALSPRQLLLRRFLRHRLAVASVGVLAASYLVAAFAEFVAPYPAGRYHIDHAYAPPQTPAGPSPTAFTRPGSSNTSTPSPSAAPTPTTPTASCR